jgi:phage-related protein
MPELAYWQQMAPLMKPLLWVGSSREDLKTFPEEVRQVMGYALYLAQVGGKHPDAKPLRGFGGAGVLEVVDDFDGDTYRAVYTVKLQGAVYALHAFQKKSKKGIKTSQHDVELVRRRLKQAEEIHARRSARARGEPGEEED